jgi:hypothetical protein
MKPITNIITNAATTGQAIGGLLTAINGMGEHLPEMRLISVSICPEMRPPSIGAPGGQMVYVACAVLEMDSPEDLAKLVELGHKMQAPPGMTILK